METREELLDTLRQHEDTITLVGGALLAVIGLRRGSLGGLVLALAGSALVARAFTVNAPEIDEEGAPTPVWKGPVRVRKAITIQRSRQEIFDFWRQFENLPRFMKHLEEVKTLDERTSRWTARAPLSTVTWDAEITAETPGVMIAWRSLDGAQIENHGVVTFTDAPGGRGTEVTVELEYAPPAGKLGAMVAKLFGEEPQSQIHEDLLRLRALLETGEVPTIDGQPSDQVRRAKGLIGTRVFGASTEREAEAV
jgi:uncharacterized membrane protein